MAQSQHQEGSRFTVDLGGVKLPAIVEKQVETEIRAVVLRALGDTDFSSSRRLPASIFDVFSGRTLGLWLDPEADSAPLGGPLGPVDHTLIVREVMRNPLQVLKALRVTKGDPRPSGAEVLEAALDVDEIDAYSKDRMREALDILAQLEQAGKGATTTKALQKATRGVEARISGRPLPEQVRLLRDATLRSGIGIDGQEEATEIAARILEDGASSIYSPDFGFHRLLRTGTAGSVRRDTVDGVKDADAIGATAGGFAGTLVPGVGTAAGAAAGGAGASAGVAVAALIEWLWE